MAKIDQMKNIAFLTFNFLICQTIPKKISSRQRCTDCDFATICRSLQYTGVAPLHFSICSFLSRLQRPLDNPAVHSYVYLPRNGRVWKSRMGNIHVQCITIRRTFMFKVQCITIRNMRNWTLHVQLSQSSAACAHPQTKRARIYHLTQRYKSCLPQVKIFQGSRVCHVTEEESGKWISLLWRRSPISALFHLWTPAVIIIQKLVFRLHRNLQNSSILSS